jgi:shikimate dehydrogenase
MIAAGQTVVSGVGYPELRGKHFDVVINGTSSSLSDERPPLPEGLFAEGSLAYEMMYGRGVTPFLAYAAEQGASRMADGLGMLVEQAAESFRLWRGVEPQTRPVIEALRTT